MDENNFYPNQNQNNNMNNNYNVNPMQQQFEQPVGGGYQQPSPTPEMSNNNQIATKISDFLYSVPVRTRQLL